MQRRRTIWSEEVDYGTLTSPRVLGPLAARRIELVAAVRPAHLAAAPALVAACRERGVRVGLWPMLDDAEGRWASAANASRFCAFTRRLLDACARAGAVPDEVALDFEPPISSVRRSLGGDAGAFVRLRREARSRRQFEALVRDIRAAGARTLAAVVPMIALPGPAAAGWERLLGTPVAGLPLDRVSVMAYTSLFEGYSRRMLRREDARVLLARFAAGARQRFGERASLSLGTVGGGALGSERPYRSAGELADDVAVARAGGVDDLALFDLGGLLERAGGNPAGGSFDAWLEAFCAPATAALPPATRRSRAALLMASTTGRMAARLPRVRRRR